MVKSKNVLHSPDTLLGFYLLPLASTRLNSSLPLELPQFVKYSSEILVHLDIIASFSCSRFVGIHDANLLFDYIPKVLYCIENWWLWRHSELSELTVIFKILGGDYLNFVIWWIILLEAVFRWIHRVHKRMDMVNNNNTQIGCVVKC